ncbi:MAG: type II toxin-antitoxin system RelE/ParE family toxin [Oscillibacter sp.]|nr:type II toxin-antitoxin system RelE/ParE family toxin [Oscillibacter sp.]
MNWKLLYLPEAVKDLERPDKSRRVLVQKMMDKVRANPLPLREGGYGKPLGNQSGYDLTGLLKIKLRSSGIRVVYRLVRTEAEMQVVVIGARDEMEVYRTAWKRRKKYGV